MESKERRYFRRYDNRSKCEVMTGSKSFEGETTNYSDGLCAVFRNSPQITKGIQANIKVLNPEMNFNGEVVWVKESGDKLRVGFRRLDAFQGLLKNYALSDLLIGFQISKRTGVLKIESGSTVKGILIKDGFLIYAFSNKKEDGLCEIFLREKKISHEKYEQVNTYLKKSNEKIEKIFVEFGVLKPNELTDAIRHQVEEIIISLFAFEDGKFIFLEGSPTTEKLLPLRVSVANIIYQSIKRLGNIDHIKQTIPDVHALLEISPGAKRILQYITIEDFEKKILSNINGARSLDSIILLSHLDEFDTLRSICAFLSIRLITVRKVEKAPVEVETVEIVSYPTEKKAAEPAEEVEGFAEKYETLSEPGKMAEDAGLIIHAAPEIPGDEVDDFIPAEELVSEPVKEEAKEVLEDRLIEEQLQEEETTSHDVEEAEKIADEEILSPPGGEPEVVMDAAASYSPEEAAGDKSEETQTEHTSYDKDEELNEQEAQPDEVDESFEEGLNREVKGEKKRSLYIPVGIGVAIITAVTLFIVFNKLDKKDITTLPATTEKVSEDDVKRDEIDTPLKDPPNNRLASRRPSKQPAGKQNSVATGDPPRRENRSTKLKVQSQKPGTEEQSKDHEAAPAEPDQNLSGKAGDSIKDTEKKIKPETTVASRVVQRAKRKQIRGKSLFASSKVLKKEPLPKKIQKPVSDPAVEKPEQVSKENPVARNENYMRYKDQFNNNAGEWDIYNMTMAVARIAEGNYFIENKSKNTEHIALHHADFPLGKKFILEASIKTVKKASDNHSYGFVIGAKGPSNCYVFQVKEGEFYSIKRYQNGASHELAGGRIAGQFLSNNTYNSLKIERAGNKMIFYINNNKLDELSDLIFFGKKIGFLVGGKSEIAIDYTRSQIWLD